MARRVVAMNQKTPVIGKGYLALGIGCCCKASTGNHDHRVVVGVGERERGFQDARLFLKNLTLNLTLRQARVLYVRVARRCTKDPGCEVALRL